MPRGFDKFRIWESESLTFLSPLKRENGVSASLLAGAFEPARTRYAINNPLCFLFFFFFGGICGELCFPVQFLNFAKIINCRSLLILSCEKNSLNFPSTILYNKYNMRAGTCKRFARMTNCCERLRVTSAAKRRSVSRRAAAKKELTKLSPNRREIEVNSPYRFKRKN